jgi:hypothetical protein
MPSSDPLAIDVEIAHGGWSMKSHTTSLFRLTTSFFALLLALSVFSSAHDNQILAGEPMLQRETIFIGPFKLGDWLEESEVKIGGLFDFGTPDRKEIIKSLNECHAFILDERITEKGKRPRFGEPKLVVSGRLKHVFATKTSGYSIQIATLNASDTRTDYSQNPAVRSLSVGVTIETAGSNVIGTSKGTIHFGPKKHFAYDIDGVMK